MLLRRRKSDVETELPGRSVKTYLVPMALEQAARYEEYRAPVAKLVSIAKRRPLLPREFERLQMLLACMRMICDTPAILDPECRVCPKLEELGRILVDLLQEPGRKIIIFSEWERMLSLVRELASELGVEAAWHTGSVPQLRRREEINRFKNDPDCRLFLSTASGSVGLNLQAQSWFEQARRAVEMAQVLAAGGFPEEAPPLFAKALRCVVAARLSLTGEAPVDAALTHPEQARRFVEPAALAEADRVFAALAPGAPSPTAAQAGALASSAARLVAALGSIVGQTIQ